MRRTYWSICAILTSGRASGVARLLAYRLKELHWNQATRALERITRFIPFLVVFACDDVQEVASGEGEVARTEGLLWREIRKCFDHLFVAMS